MKQQLIVRFIVYMILTLLLTTIYYVIGPSNNGFKQEFFNNFQPFPDILPGDVGVNEISNDIYATNVHRCDATNKASCANGYVCKEPGPGVFKNGVELNASLTYCIPDNLILQQDCNAYVGKYVWAEDGGVSTMTCKQTYPNMYNASESNPTAQNAYPCNLNKAGTDSLLSTDNGLMNSESAMFYYNDSDSWELTPPYTIEWNPYKGPTLSKTKSLLENFTPYDTVCEWYNHLPEITTEGKADWMKGTGIETFAYYSQDNASKDNESLLFSQNKNACGVFDPESYKCHTYSDAECISSDICMLSMATNKVPYCKPRCSKIVSEENKSSCPPTCALHELGNNIYYCGPKKDNINKYLKVLPKIRDDDGMVLKKKPLWNCRCLSKPKIGDEKNEYCNQIPPSGCKSDICELNKENKCVRKLNEYDSYEDSILFPENLYTCNNKTCWGGGDSSSQLSFTPFLNEWNTCVKTTSEYDCSPSTQSLIDGTEKGCVWEPDTQMCNLPLVKDTEGNSTNTLIDYDVMTKYMCEFKGKRWIPKSDIPPSYKKQIEDARGMSDLFLSPSPNSAGTGEGICLKQGYSCQCSTEDSQVSSVNIMKSNKDGRCYITDCGFYEILDQLTPPGTNTENSDIPKVASFGPANIDITKPFEPRCQCNEGVDTDRENNIIYCNSDLIDNHNMCSEYTDYNSCEGFRGGWCVWDSTSPTPCKNVCQAKETKQECASLGLGRCQWYSLSPSESDKGGYCSLATCDKGKGQSTGQYCIDECLPSPCNGAKCNFASKHVDHPVSISCSKALPSEYTGTEGITGQCVDLYPGTTMTYGDPGLGSVEGASLKEFVNQGPIVKSNTFCQSQGLGMSQPVANIHMNFKADNNPYYTNESSAYSNQTEMNPEIHKTACAKGYRPVKWTSQVEPTGRPYGRGTGNSDTTSHTWHATNSNYSATGFDPSQAWVMKSEDDHGFTDDNIEYANSVIQNYNDYSNSSPKLGFSWSGQSQYDTYKPTIELKPGYGNQQCQASTAWSTSCDNMRGEGSAWDTKRDWYNQGDERSLTGLYKDMGKELWFGSYGVGSENSPGDWETGKAAEIGTIIALAGAG